MQLLVYLVAHGALCRLVCGQTQTATSVTPATADKPLIRIAYFYHVTEAFTPMKYMMLKFNDARTLLPDYEVSIDAFPYRPEDRASPIEVVRVLQDDTPTYHAIVGPWSRQDSMDMVRLVALARILHVHKGDSTVLSDRETYPYTFRVLRSIQGIQTTWYGIASSNGWHTVISVWQEADTYATSYEVAKNLNVTNHPSLAERDQATWAVDAWQTDLIQHIRSSRIRVVMTYIDVLRGWQLICRAHRSRLLGIQYFATSSWGNGWFLRQFPPAYGDCTTDEMYTAASGHVVTLHTPVAPGVLLLGALYVPPIGGDQSQTPLTCMPSITPHVFYNGGEHHYLALLDGFFSDPAAAALYMGNAGSETDQVCAVLLGLHDVIYNKGVSLDSIAQREPVAFQTLVEAVERVDFHGPTGHFRFYNNSGDPEYIYYVISQQAMEGKHNSTTEISAVVTYPDGRDGEPQLEITHPLGLRWQDGSSGLGPNNAGLFDDCGSENAILIWDYCEPCPPGTYYDKLLQACRTCPAGAYQSSAGAADCIAAARGWYVADASNPIEATLCPPGYECQQESMTQPVPCRSGEFANSSGQPECELCPVGTYQPEGASSLCLDCGGVLEGSTTANLASRSSKECLCPAGSYRPLEQNKCVECLTGMSCPQGSDEQNLVLSVSNSSASSLSAVGPHPVPLSGYMSRSAKPLEVFRCSEEKHCPGGRAALCDDFRDATTVACGDCVADAYEAGDTCEPCGNASALPFIGVSISVAVVVIVATIMVNRDIHKTSAASLMIVAVSGLLFTSIQSLGVFRQMAIPWVEPIKSILLITQILSFDLKLLKVTCVMGVNPVRSFALRQTYAVLAIPFVLATLSIKKLWLLRRRKKMRVGVELTNTIGTLYSIFFISIIISAMDPFICYEHPNGNGESVRSAPSLLCFEGGDHTAMVIIGLVALCIVPLPFLALCMFGVFGYAQSIRSRRSQHFLHAMRFLFFRYTPTRYYFQVLVLLRSLLLCCGPVIFRAQASTQVLFMCIVLGWYILVVEEMRPWRAPACTPLDASITMLLLVMLVCGALYIEDSPQQDTITALSTTIIVSVGACSITAIGYAAWRRLTPRPFYNFFICHHKAHAAAQARYMKTVLLRRRRNLQVFIDSDNLQELDNLFDIVKCRVGHLVAYLTADTLKRPWCAGEVVTALRAQVKITRFHTPSFSPPTDEQCTNPEVYLDTVGCNLNEYGIHWEDITVAFRQFLGQAIPQVDMDVHAPGTKRFEKAAAALLKQRSAQESAPSLTEVRSRSVFIAACTESDEAIATAGILVARISENVFRVCEEGLALLADYRPDFQNLIRVVRTASVGVVMLTAGCLRYIEHDSIICELMQLQPAIEAPAVISVCAPGFEFPSPGLIDRLCQELPELEDTYGENTGELLKAFFKRISIALPTHASQHALNTQADEVFQRIEAHVKGHKSQLAVSSNSLSLTRTPESPVQSHTRTTRSAGFRISSKSEADPKKQGTQDNSLDPNDFAFQDEDEEFKDGKYLSAHLPLESKLKAIIWSEDV